MIFELVHIVQDRLAELDLRKLPGKGTGLVLALLPRLAVARPQPTGRRAHRALDRPCDAAGGGR